MRAAQVDVSVRFATIELIAARASAHATRSPSAAVLLLQLAPGWFAELPYDRTGTEVTTTTTTLVPKLNKHVLTALINSTY